MHSRTLTVEAAWTWTVEAASTWTLIWQVGALRRRGREAAEMVRSEAEPEHLPKASTFHIWQVRSEATYCSQLQAWRDA